MPKKPALNNKKLTLVRNPRVVTEVELIAVETTRLTLAKFREQERKAEAALEQMEAEIILRLKNSAVVQGSKTAVIEDGLSQFSPKWKEMHIKHMEAEHGLTEGACEEIARKVYPQKPVEKLVIGDKNPS